MPPLSCSPNSPQIQQSPNSRTQTAPTSLFTIDSILAPTSTKANQAQHSINNNRSSESPGSSPPASANTSPIRPRLPMLHHPGLHLGHLAAAASGFGSTSEFLGKSLPSITLNQNKTKELLLKSFQTTNF